MAKKRKNPFEGNANNIRPKSPEEMSMEDLTRELEYMEKTLGKEKFNQLLEEALSKLENMDEDEFAEEFGEEFDDGFDDEFDDKFYDEFDIEPVTTKEWSKTHPANIVCGSDSYYADLATDLADIIDDFNIQVKNHDKLARELGRVLAAYLEDIVSETKVFSAMRRVCMQKYGYRLPFYDCNHDDYMLDHINVEDIRFLIWMTVCRVGRENQTTYSPLAPGWALLADRVFDELNSLYEEAPEATRVADWLRRAFRKEDYIDIREIAIWLVFGNPLTYIPDFLDSIETEATTASMEDRIDPLYLRQMVYGLIAFEAWQRSMSPMGCPSRTLTAALATEFGHDALASDIEAIEVLTKQVYAATQDKKTRKIFFETSRHEKLEIRKDSFAKGFKVTETPYVSCNLVKYKGEYLLNGVLAGDSSMKEEWETQHHVLATYELQREEARRWIDILDGQQVVCVASMKNLLKKLGLPTKTMDMYPDAENFVVLISKELGIAILPDMGYAFNIPGNRFYRKRMAAQDSFNDAVFHNAMPHDVAMYIQENHLLPEARIGASQGTEVGRKIVQDYLAFWIGFYCELPAYGHSPNQKPAEDDID